MESHDGDLEGAKINKMSYERMKYEGPGQSKQVEGGQRWRLREVPSLTG